MSSIEQGQAEPGEVPSGLPPAGEASGPGGRSRVLSRPRPTPQPKIELCPYCGRESVNTTRCSTCGGYFDALSKQATQNAMGPWWLRDGDRPVKPGCSYDTIRGMVAKGSITRDTVLRGPTTRQFWMRARRAPGVAHLLGVCHSCQREVSPDAFMCQACGASFNTETDRQHLGLSPVSLLPGQAAAERIAAVSAAGAPLPPAPVHAVAGPDPRMSWAGAPRQAGAGTLGPGTMSQPVTSLETYQLTAATVDDGSSAHTISGSYGFEDVGTRRRRRPVSVAGAAGMMLLGVLIAVGAMWLVLVRTHGSVEGALAAIGMGERPVVLAGGGGQAPGNEPEAGETSQSAARGTPDPDVAGSRRVEQQGTTEQSDRQTPVATAPPTDPVPDPRAQVASAASELRTQMEQRLARGEWRAIPDLVEQLERIGQVTPEEAASWRMAVEARLDRQGLASLP